MTALQSTRHSWRLHLSEVPLPAMLPREVDVVRVSMGLGMVALDAMIDDGHQVGPLLCCITHRRLLVPVKSGIASLWSAPHSVCDMGRSLQCAAYGPQVVCQGRFWVIPPEPRAYPTTDPWVLHHCLCLARAQMRNVGKQPAAIGTQAMCHV
ncbi:hypothetical protein [Streptomyces sp. NPDC003032]